MADGPLADRRHALGCLRLSPENHLVAPLQGHRFRPVPAVASHPCALLRLVVGAGHHWLVREPRAPVHICWLRRSHRSLCRSLHGPGLRHHHVGPRHAGRHALPQARLLRRARAARHAGQDRELVLGRDGLASPRGNAPEAKETHGRLGRPDDSRGRKQRFGFVILKLSPYSIFIHQLERRTNHISLPAAATSYPPSAPSCLARLVEPRATCSPNDIPVLPRLMMDCSKPTVSLLCRGKKNHPGHANLTPVPMSRIVEMRASARGRSAMPWTVLIVQLVVLQVPRVVWIPLVLRAPLSRMPELPVLLLLMMWMLLILLIWLLLMWLVSWVPLCLTAIIPFTLAISDRRPAPAPCVSLPAAVLRRPVRPSVGAPVVPAITTAAIQRRTIVTRSVQGWSVISRPIIPVPSTFTTVAGHIRVHVRARRPGVARSASAISVTVPPAVVTAVHRWRGARWQSSLTGHRPVARPRRSPFVAVAMRVAPSVHPVATVCVAVTSVEPGAGAMRFGAHANRATLRGWR